MAKGVIHTESFKWVCLATEWLNDRYSKIPVLAIDAILTHPEVMRWHDQMEEACRADNVEETKLAAREWMLAIKERIDG
jgi:3'-phosphoadenosine 5'-phosphosulfate sulfotransferase (PAPS reductase)/FAD synthetase